VLGSELPKWECCLGATLAYTKKKITTTSTRKGSSGNCRRMHTQKNPSTKKNSEQKKWIHLIITQYSQYLISLGDKVIATGNTTKEKGERAKQAISPTISALQFCFPRIFMCFLYRFSTTVSIMLKSTR
jgi:hypothetical protein